MLVLLILMLFSSPAWGLALGGYTLPAEICDAGEHTSPTDTATSSNNLNNLIDGAAAGETIFIRNDVIYNDASYTIDSNGTSGNPVTYVCDPNARAIFRLTTVRITGNWNVVKNCFFDDSVAWITGDNNWVTRNEFNDVGENIGCSNSSTVRKRVVLVADDAEDNKISNNTITDTKAGCRVLGAKDMSGNHSNNLFYRNLVNGIGDNEPQPIDPNNSGEALQAGSSSSASDFNAFAWFVDNLILQARADQEIVSIKSSNNRILRNTFIGDSPWYQSANNPDQRGFSVQSRNGEDNHFVGNTVINPNDPSGNFEAGISVLDQGHLIQDNRLVNGNIVLRSGDEAASDPTHENNNTQATANTNIYHNVCEGDSAVRIGYSLSGNSNGGGSVSVTNTDTFGNSCNIQLGDQSGHSAVADPGVTRLLPVELTVLDVGIGGDDPQCDLTPPPPPASRRRSNPIYF